MDRQVHFDVPELFDWYGRMLLIRAFEETAAELHRNREIRGSLHCCAGFESSAVAICSALTPDDVVFSHHRPFGHCLARGLEPDKMMAELYGRLEGYSRGKGGSKHIASRLDGFWGAGGVVAGLLPIAAGVGYTLRLEGGIRIVVAFFGDGAANQGVFAEALNLAVVMGAPVLFVCENNQWAESTRSATVTAGESIASRAAAFGMRAEVVAAADIEEIAVVARDLITEVRGLGRPTFLEVRGYRMGGHSASVPLNLESAEEREAALASDPVATLEGILRTRGVSVEDIEARRAAAATSVAAAVEFARACEPPPLESAFEDVYAAPLVS